MKLSQSSTQLLRPGDLDHLSDAEALLIQKVADKLVRFGQLVGVTPEEMISLLDSGISIHDLVALVVSKRSGAA